MDMKPKQGAVFRAFRGYVMDIPADYNNASFVTRCNFRPPNWIPEQVSMLPIPRDQVASQECVGERVTNKEVEIWDQGPVKDRWVKFEPKCELPAKVWFAIDMEAHAGPTAEPTKQDGRAPIKILVCGCAWSPGICHRPWYWQEAYPS